MGGVGGGYGFYLARHTICSGISVERVYACSCVVTTTCSAAVLAGGPQFCTASKEA